MVTPGGVEIVKVMINWIVTNFGEYTPNVDPNSIAISKSPIVNGAPK